MSGEGTDRIDLAIKWTRIPVIVTEWVSSLTVGFIRLQVSSRHSLRGDCKHCLLAYRS